MNAHQRLLPYVPPANILRDHRIDSEYIDSAFYIAGLIQESVEVKPTSKIADIGCAAGRLCLPFMDTLTTGEYVGLDLRSDSIDWATKTITSVYPNFKFKHLDSHNEFYNPVGVPLLNLPLPGNYFDLVIFHSVFTHISFVEAQHFLAETKRILKPGGACHLTAFLWNQEAKQSYAAGTCSHDFSEQQDRYRVEHQRQASALDASSFYEELDKNGLSVLLEQLGPWRSDTDRPHGQDRFILVRDR